MICLTVFFLSLEKARVSLVWTVVRLMYVMFCKKKYTNKKQKKNLYNTGRISLIGHCEFVTQHISLLNDVSLLIEYPHGTVCFHIWLFAKLHQAYVISFEDIQNGWIFWTNIIYFSMPLESVKWQFDSVCVTKDNCWRGKSGQRVVT